MFTGQHEQAGCAKQGLAWGTLGERLPSGRVMLVPGNLLGNGEQALHKAVLVAVRLPLREVVDRAEVLARLLGTGQGRLVLQLAAEGAQRVRLQVHHGLSLLRERSRTGRLSNCANIRASCWR